MKVTKYNNFEKFMSDVLDEAEYRREKAKVYDEIVIDAIKKLLATGWENFGKVAILLALGVIPFAAALAGLAMTGIGLVIIAIFGAWAVSTMWTLYDNRELPLGLKKVGDKYKSDYEEILLRYKNDNSILKKQVDLLFEKAVKDLMRE